MRSVAFATIHGSDWRLAADAPAKCRRLVYPGQPFEAVVRDLCATMKVIEVHRNKAKSAGGYFRAHVKIGVHRDSCATFHSGNSGYRAQYYRSIADGDRANALSVASAVNAIEPQLRDTRLMTKAWIQRSLLGRDSKVWIHQGQWLRRSWHRDRLLIVDRWVGELQSQDKNRRKLARWASLVPVDEDAIDVKGTFLTLEGKPLGTNPKQGRSAQLHELGFT